MLNTLQPLLTPPSLLLRPRLAPDFHDTFSWARGTDVLQGGGGDPPLWLHGSYLMGAIAAVLVCSFGAQDGSFLVQHLPGRTRENTPVSEWRVGGEEVGMGGGGEPGAAGGESGLETGKAGWDTALLVVAPDTIHFLCNLPRAASRCMSCSSSIARPCTR